MAAAAGAGAGAAAEVAAFLATGHKLAGHASWKNGGITIEYAVFAEAALGLAYSCSEADVDPAASVIRALPLNVMTTFEESIASPRHIVLPPVGHTRHGFLIFTLTPDSDSSCWLDGRQWCVTVAFGGDEARKRIRLFDVDYSLHRVVPGIADFSWGRHHVL